MNTAQDKLIVPPLGSFSETEELSQEAHVAEYQSRYVAYAAAH